MSNLNIPAILIPNVLALFLIVQMFYGGSWKYMKNKNESTFCRILMYLCASSCIIDPLVCLADGQPGLVFRSIVYFGNLYLCLACLAVGPIWIAIISNHLYRRLPKHQKMIIRILCAVGVVLLMVNLFVPVVFLVDANNVYHREPLFWVLIGIAGLFTADCVGLHVQARYVGGLLKVFPIFQFLIPIVTGVTTQSLIYGVSVIWPSLTVSFMGLFSSLQNEALYRDSLTGLMNRLYLEEIGIAMKNGTAEVSVLMLDMNDFKHINDTYGHTEGDSVLLTMAELLNNTVGALGRSVRYAGDEFVVLLNTHHKDIVRGCAASIQNCLVQYNERSGKDYNVSVSIGCCVYDKTVFPTLESMLNRADADMYVEKKQFYRSHDRRDRDRDAKCTPHFQKNQ